MVGLYREVAIKFSVSDVFDLDWLFTVFKLVD